MPCTFLKTGKTMKNQKLYTCITCNLRQGQCICESCARICHSNHDVRSCGYKKGYCDCGAANISFQCICNKECPAGNKPAFIPGPCTFNRTGKNFIIQPFYRCITCNYPDGKGCCEWCAKICHIGHKLCYKGEIRSFCDCGYGCVEGFPICKCVQIPNPR
ncbi:hypothetical protein M9Y10_006226 [Tritrichomonas musculus]|uniref:UBR-type domain-containing protein n=1 Tax=Tritrichomonas musculus TaxID=1915356 RepID=A0ABR2JDL7_9EUKA